MDIIALLLFLAALGWFWLNSLHTLDLARDIGRKVCHDAGVQFLDDSVASTSLALARDQRGNRVLRRSYRFEFSKTGNSRLEGRLTLLGDQVETVTMEPYQILS